MKKAIDPNTVSRFTVIPAGEKESGFLLPEIKERIRVKNMNLEFRKAGTSDVPVLNSLSKQAFDTDVEVGGTSAGGPPGYMSVPFHMKMARTGHLYKLTENGLIIGGAILFQDGDELNVGRIFVNPAHFRKGYGIRMMEEIEAQFADVKVFTLDTPVWNIRTNAFYTKLGYTEVRRDGNFIYYVKRR